METPIASGRICAHFPDQCVRWPTQLEDAPSKLRLAGVFIGPDRPELGEHTHGMPWSLKHFQQSGQNHYLTFSCYQRQPKLGTPAPRDLFVHALETVRQQYESFVYGFVVMPEHVHLLVGEPEKGNLAQALQSLKQSVARRLALRAAELGRGTLEDREGG